MPPVRGSKQANLVARASQRGRPRKDEGHTKQQNARQKTDTRARRSRKKANSSQHDEIGQEDELALQPSRRGRTPDEETGEDDDRPKKRFNYLKPRVRKIPQHVITSKWAPLGASTQQQTRDLIRAAKRPVTIGIRDDRRRIEAEVTLGSVIRKLERQLPRMPFPPNTRDFHFDLEALIDRNRTLENQLTPALHSVEMLKAAIKREEGALEQEQKTLARLEADAKAEERRQARQTAKIHPLLSLPDDFRPAGDDASEIGFVRTAGNQMPTLDDEDDQELAPLLEQLQHHLESISTNMAQVDGIEAAISVADALVGEALSQRRLGG
ncbi:CENP-Q, a CENPA-CAD centromere complex subunit-domain-containing protein [Lineolata rhizophorae]|uniref:CENP-Q, a CENPA-CAD centromere complex subunit-domain-containing protein n=1 Tax=Lineolata rhizophorae TaxID=578093 RepID=A0A6A6P9R8_9PEZI|nr:CENP-Q, a CENPA-CAD centromere complex subunit-domain-containing protein [Lineolata rhizophorae]